MSVILLNPLGAAQSGGELVRRLRLHLAKKPRRALGEEQALPSFLLAWFWYYSGGRCVEFLVEVVLVK